MIDAPPPKSYHRHVVVGLVLLNLVVILLLLWAGGTGQRDLYFRQGEFYSWFYGAQMFGAALLFVGCFFASRIIPVAGVRPRDTVGWLVFAAGFLLLAADQVFRLREQLSVALGGGAGLQEVPQGPHLLLKVVAVVVAVALVLFFRRIVLPNVRMVLAFVAGFGLLLMMLAVDLLLESVGMTATTVVITEGAIKLLAMAVFLSAPFIVLFDRLDQARLMARRAAMRQPGVERLRRRLGVEQQEDEEGPSDDEGLWDGPAAQQAQEPADAAAAADDEEPLAAAPAPDDEPDAAEPADSEAPGEDVAPAAKEADPADSEAPGEDVAPAAKEADPDAAEAPVGDETPSGDKRKDSSE